MEKTIRVRAGLQKSYGFARITEIRIEHYGEDAAVVLCFFDKNDELRDLLWLNIFDYLSYKNQYEAIRSDPRRDVGDPDVIGGYCNWVVKNDDEFLFMRTGCTAMTENFQIRDEDVPKLFEAIDECFREMKNEQPNNETTSTT